MRPWRGGDGRGGATRAQCDAESKGAWDVGRRGTTVEMLVLVYARVSSESSSKPRGHSSSRGFVAEGEMTVPNDWILRGTEKIPHRRSGEVRCISVEEDAISAALKPRRAMAARKMSPMDKCSSYIGSSEVYPECCEGLLTRPGHGSARLGDRQPGHGDVPRISTMKRLP